MAYNVGKQIVTDGLILHLDAGNIRSYVGAGTTWYDITGNTNNGSLVNSPLYDSGAIILDGLNDYVNCGIVTAIGPSLSGLSVSAWINPYQNASKCIVENGTSHLTNTFFLWHFANYFSFAIAGPSGFDQINANFNFVINSWYHLTGTWYTSGRVSLYSNGKLVDGTRGGGIQTSLINGDTPLFIGSRNYSTYLFNGKVGHLSCYNRALTQSEIQQNFEALRGRYGI